MLRRRLSRRSTELGLPRDETNAPATSLSCPQREGAAGMDFLHKRLASSQKRPLATSLKDSRYALRASLARWLEPPNRPASSGSHLLPAASNS